MKKIETQLSATMVIPKGGKQAWSNISYGETPVAKDINEGSPLVMATAYFEDGTWVAGGVYKGSSLTDYNFIFMWVFDHQGNQYPAYPIDVIEKEDFFFKGIHFSLRVHGKDRKYFLNVVEADSKEATEKEHEKMEVEQW
jgi:hypothetical protein